MRFQLFSDMNFRDHHLDGVVWPVVSSRTGESYKVTLTTMGFTCNCTAGSIRGKCKHAQQVHDLLVSDDYIMPKDEFQYA